MKFKTQIRKGFDRCTACFERDLRPTVVVRGRGSVGVLVLPFVDDEMSNDTTVY